MVARWSHELLGYHFSVLHRPAQMMIDVDGLTRCFDKLSVKYAHIGLLLSNMDYKALTSAYTGSIVGCSAVSNIKPDTNREGLVISILTISTITSYIEYFIFTPAANITLPLTKLSSVSIILHSAVPMPH